MLRLRNRLILSLAFLMLTTSVATAQNPFKKIRLPFGKKVEADRNKTYKITNQNGPWLILAASFFEEAGEQQARELVMELRKTYKLEAYMYQHKIDVEEDVYGRGFEKKVEEIHHPNGTRENRLQFRKMKLARSADAIETTVLIGDFSSTDDQRAAKALKTLKLAHPKSLEVKPGAKTYQRLAVLRHTQQMSMKDEGKKLGPMRAAFMIPNPLIPEEYFTNKGPDEFILKLNKKVKHSLLDCKGQYSVRIATFRGETLLNADRKKTEKRGFGFLKPKEESKLNIALDKAHRLTEALRAKGIEAYEFHDRHESFVCVGSFNNVGSERRDGKIEINPEMHKIIEKFQGNSKNVPGLEGAVRPRSLRGLPGIVFDLQPVPVKVPKQSIAQVFGSQSRR